MAFELSSLLKIKQKKIKLARFMKSAQCNAKCYITTTSGPMSEVVALRSTIKCATKTLNGNIMLETYLAKKFVVTHPN